MASKPAFTVSRLALHQSTNVSMIGKKKLKIEEWLMKRRIDCWSKLIPFSLTQYERIVQLDSDMVVLRNMDELMDLPLDPEGSRVFAASHACVCNPLKKPHYP